MVGAILSVLSLLAAHTAAHESVQPVRATANMAVQTISVVRACEAVVDATPQTRDRAAFEALVRTWLATCRQAVAVSPENLRVRLGMARALTANGQQEEAIRHLRHAAAGDDMEALFALYLVHVTQDAAAETNKKPLVPVAAAEYSLRRAAELGHPEAMLRLAVALDQGGVMERDPVAARFWVEELLRRSPEDQPPTHLLTMLGRLLVESQDSMDRARGLKILDGLATSRGIAQPEVALVGAFR